MSTIRLCIVSATTATYPVGNVVDDDIKNDGDNACFLSNSSTTPNSNILV